ncbi:MAG TPA: hypothetical protein VK801_06835 [Caulobacteraceae bacterium]|nr:hypothetical protein [Caulobacteraceae bacterium]
MTGNRGALAPELETRFEPLVVAEPAPRAAPPAAVFAALTLGCVALLMLGVQPAVLGALLSAHRLTVGQLTQAATVEMLALGLVSGIMAGVLQHRRLRLWGGVGCLGLVVANLAGFAASGEMFVVSRGVAGAAGGVLVWIVSGVIARHPTAVRLAALFAGAQSISQAALAAALPFIALVLGANAGVATLGICAALCAVLLVGIPADLPDLPRAEPGRGALSVQGVFGLLAAFLLMAGIVGVWVFADELARMAGASPALASAAIAASLAMQVVGAVFMVAVGPKAPPGRSYIAVAAGFLVVVALIAWTHGGVAFMAAALLLGFLWNIALSLSTPLLIQIDPTRRAAMLAAGAQLLGGSAGPMLTGLFASEADVRPVLAPAALLFVGVIVCATIAIAPRRTRAG